MSLPPGDLAHVASLLLRETGIALAPDQGDWLEARLAPLARRLELPDAAAVVRELRLRPTPDRVRAVVEALTTHETSFFRDEPMFAALRETVIPELIARRSATAPIRIWSAACSTGQEPYSLAFLLRDHFALHLSRIELYATDLSHEVVARAAAGRYTSFEVNRGLPATALVRHFTQRPGAFEVRPEVRAMIRFAPQNLVAPWHVPAPVDILLLRNVLYYFDDRARADVIARAGRALGRDGVLVLGGTEALPPGGPFVRQAVGRTSVFRLAAIASRPAPTAALFGGS